MKNVSPRKRANLRDVAAAANVSVATVSRVMNAPQTVAEATRKRVEDAMADLRWVPSAAARAINSGRTRFVGALVPTLEHDIFARVLASLESQLALHRLSLIVATTQGDPDIETQKAKALIDIGAEGLIISGTTHAPEFHALIEHSQIPTVATSVFDPDYSLPTIGYDNAGAAQAALAHLTDLGHCDIAVIHGPSASNDRTAERVEALRATAIEGTMTFFETPLTIAGGGLAARAALQSGREHTAFLCLSDVLATGALYEMHRAGLQIPRDKSIIGTDDLPGSAHLYPALTTVHLPVARMGLAAADAIAGWLETQIVPEVVMLDFDLRVRESTAPPRSG
ncbi:substrate-binding domain-containing protein [Albirhodobacter sp. R86504]|uniref:substrate-binding domain-containing protein n=1 Tax=Albirhodobacter sp. R86504 TaxID=3093848 RepID=UPI00366A7EEC